MKIFVAVVLIAGTFASYAHAAVLSVDINGSGGPTQNTNGFLGMTINAQDNSASQVFTDPFNTGDDVTVTLVPTNPHSSNNPDDGVPGEFGSLPLLVRDMMAMRFFRASDGAMSITFSGLPEGDYSYIGYHHRQVATEAGAANVLLNDVQYGIADRSIGGATSYATFTVDFTISNLGDDAKISYSYHSGAEKFFPVNGFELELIPEPASLMLLGLGGLLMLNRGPRR